MATFQTNNELMNYLLNAYDEDKADYSQWALKQISAHFDKQTSKSDIDPRKLGTRANFVSKLRMAALERAGPIDEPGQHEFNKMNIREQLKFQAQARAADSPKWVLNLQIMPANLINLKLSNKDTADLEQIRTDRNKTRLTSDMKQINADELLQTLLKPLESPESATWQKLTLGILIATGRRTIEILKTGDFYLDKTHDNNGYICMFSGQAKEGLFPVGRYEIPLLAPFNFVKEALDILRQKLPSNISDISNTEVNETYAKSLSKNLSSVTKDSRLKPHDLRAIYAISCYNLLKGNKMSMIGFISRILGHANASNAAYYQHFNVSIKGPYIPSSSVIKETPVTQTTPNKTVETENSTDGWIAKCVADAKRIPIVKELMNRKIRITASAMRTHGGGTMSVNERFITRNSERIDKYNKSL